MQAIETTATIYDKDKLKLDKPIDFKGNGKVRVIIMFPEESDIDEKEWLKAASTNPAFDFLNDPKEDIYTHEDGEPFNDEG